MPIVKNLSDRATKFSAKTAPDRVGTRYEASKAIAISRYGEGISIRVAVQEAVKNILGVEGVPPGQQGVYFAFAFKAVKASLSHKGKDLEKFIEGLKARFTAKGADPAILDKIAVLFVG